MKRELNGLHITVLVSKVGGGIKNPLMSEFAGNSSCQNTEAVSKESLFAMHLTHALLLTFRKNYTAAGPSSSVWALWRDKNAARSNLPASKARILNFMVLKFLCFFS